VGDTLDGQRARAEYVVAAAVDSQLSEKFATSSHACRTFVDSSVVYLERCIKNDLNLSRGLVLRVVTHSLIGLD